MGHWLEEVENRQKKSRHHSRNFRKKISEKKRHIRENYEKNKELYNGFLEIMYGLVKRVNDLPDELRDPFRKINAVSKKSKLDNYLNYFYTSKREQKYDFFSFLWMKPIHAKHIRSFYIYVSKNEGLVNFELKENFLIRKRETGEERDKKSHHEKSNRSKDRMHVIYHFPITKLDKNTGLELIDWLAFKKPLHELTFWTDIPIEEKQFF